VTGFGLLGHLREMVAGSGQVRARLRRSAVPVQAGAERLARAGVFPGGTRANLTAAQKDVRFDDALPEHERLLLADAQTSGGLLIALPQDAARALVEALHAGGNEEAAIIGEVVEGAPGVDVGS